MSPFGTIEAEIVCSQAIGVAVARVSFGSFGSGVPTLVRMSIPDTVCPAATLIDVRSVARSKPDSPEPL